ncbi:structural polyprotein [Microbat bastrovirus]|nr:structural polyprotein [Microbat bastrovirus]
MAPRKSTQSSRRRAPQRARSGRIQRRRPTQNITRRIASMVIRNSKMIPRNSQTSRTNTRGAVNINSVSTLNGTERVTTVTIPVNTQPGQLLYVLENNPNSAPRASAVASQFDSWHSVTELEVETTGNAFAKNFLVIRHVPNGDRSRLPPAGDALLNFAEAYSRRGESYKLQLDSNNKGVVRATWNNISYNPHKPIQDDDPSERNNGLFIIVANGSPGTDPVDITIRYRYSFRFFGPIFKAVVPAVISHITSVSPTISSILGITPTVVGPGFIRASGNTLTIVEPSECFIYLNLAGTGITGPSTATANLGAMVTNLATVINSAQVTLALKINTVLPNTVVTFSVPAGLTLITGTQIFVTPYDYSLS